MNFYKTVLNILSLFLVLFCNFDKVESVKKISPKNSLVGINRDNIKIRLNNCHLTIRGRGYYKVDENFFGKFEHLKEFVKSISFEGNIVSIGDYAFSCFTNLRSVKIPKSVKSIGEYAFNCCFNLNSVIFEGPSSVKTIGSNAFRCSDIVSINIPKSVESI